MTTSRLKLSPDELCEWHSLPQHLKDAVIAAANGAAGVTEEVRFAALHGAYHVLRLQEQRAFLSECGLSQFATSADDGEIAAVRILTVPKLSGLDVKPDELFVVAPNLPPCLEGQHVCGELARDDAELVLAVQEAKLGAATNYHRLDRLEAALNALCLALEAEERRKILDAAGWDESTEWISQQAGYLLAQRAILRALKVHKTVAWLVASPKARTKAFDPWKQVAVEGRLNVLLRAAAAAEQRGDDGTRDVLVTAIGTFCAPPGRMPWRAVNANGFQVSIASLARYTEGPQGLYDGRYTAIFLAAPAHGGPAKLEVRLGEQGYVFAQREGADADDGSEAAELRDALFAAGQRPPGEPCRSKECVTPACDHTDRNGAPVSAMLDFRRARQVRAA